MPFNKLTAEDVLAEAQSILDGDHSETDPNGVPLSKLTRISKSLSVQFDAFTRSAVLPQYSEQTNPYRELNHVEAVFPFLGGGYFGTRNVSVRVTPDLEYGFELPIYTLEHSWYGIEDTNIRVVYDTMSEFVKLTSSITSGSQREQLKSLRKYLDVAQYLHNEHVEIEALQGLIPSEIDFMQYLRDGSTWLRLRYNFRSESSIISCSVPLEVEKLSVNELSEIESLFCMELATIQFPTRGRRFRYGIRNIMEYISEGLLQR